MVKTKKIDEVANLWNKTKDSKYKEIWYKLLKEFTNGRASTLPNTIITPVRRNTGKRSSRVHKTDDSDGMSGLGRCP